MSLCARFRRVAGIVIAGTLVSFQGWGGASLDRTATQWAPYVEWTLPNGTAAGNPYDVEGTATFTHSESGASHTTGMFFDGGAAWKFRFTGTQPGVWTFTTRSGEPELNGHSGSVIVAPSDTPYGFVTHADNKWARPAGTEGTLEAFMPQFVMYGHPGTFWRKPEAIQESIDTFIHGHGFTGFHVPICCRWFDIEQESARNIASNSPNPDPRTFEALEMLITKVHGAGGTVHFWAWGDESRRQTPKKWGINGDADRRLQRYIAARLGPLPGWTLGYGFDLDEWVNERQLGAWRDFMHEQMGWPHLLGGRHGDPNQGLDHSMARSWNLVLDYASYEHHRPSTEVYKAALDAIPGKPVFSEDRFRIRQSERYRFKDYTEEMTRRGLWHSAMAGGVANIWGKLDGDLGINAGLGQSCAYDHPDRLKTWARFFRERFQLDSEPAEGMSDGYCLKSQRGKHLVFYRENALSIQMDLSAMNAPRRAVAVDAKKEYAEIEIGILSPSNQTWHAPYESDWAIAVGEAPWPNAVIER